MSPMRLGTIYNKGRTPVRKLVQEASGIHTSIAPDLTAAAEHASELFLQQYRQWRATDRFNAWGAYKRDHFTVAVGGGNTVRALFRAWLAHADTIDWLAHVRFFFTEESTGEVGWRSADATLAREFIEPLVHRLCQAQGTRKLARKLKLPAGADRGAVIEAATSRMCCSLDLTAARQALDAGAPRKAARLARAESDRYQQLLAGRLGASMACHCIVSGIGRDGSIGSLTPYAPELANREPRMLLLKRPSGALRAAMSRQVIANAERLLLLVSGSLKLKVLGRFEMEESADFEQTVRETPVRLLRENSTIASKVFLFADEQSLNFEETVFAFRTGGERISIKAETRPGDEPEGVHMLLLHGFLGLFSFANLLVRLPSSWTASALHRGSRAKLLPREEVFPHYAMVLRKAIIKLWRQGHPVPIAGHSIAGLIFDHLLLSVAPDENSPVPPYEALGKEERELVDALRVGGIVNLATWCPSDGPNTGVNIRSLRSHLKHQTALDYSGLDQHYGLDTDGGLTALHDDEIATSSASLARLDRWLDLPLAQPVVNSLNVGMRALLNNRRIQQRMLNTEMPYALRLVGSRLLRTVSLYGLAREINAAMHDTALYQRRHQRALDVIASYGIPWLSIIHEDDFLVSARRHREEFRYLQKRAKQREGVSRASELATRVRHVALQREADELPVDPLNPHLLLLSTTHEGNSMARSITAEMTRFVNENLAAAIAAGNLPPLASVARWQQKQGD